MITVKCHYENGDTVTTGINATFEGAVKYFVGKTFNIGSVEDNMQRCLKTELVSPIIDGKIEEDINRVIITSGKFKYHTGILVKATFQDKGRDNRNNAILYDVRLYGSDKTYGFYSEEFKTLEF